jgi:hypothetical protein
MVLGNLTLTAQTNNKLHDSLIKKTMAFYRFYEQNQKAFNAAGLYNSVNKNQSGPPYKIHWTGVNKYFKFLRTKATIHVGEQFITNEKLFFLQCDSNFKAYPDEEMPFGFDYDRIVGGQEDPKYVIQFNFAKGGKWSVHINADTAVVSYKVNYQFDKKVAPELITSSTQLVKEKGIWKIAKPMGMMFEALPD